MQLFHLNWEKSVKQNAEEHLRIVMPVRSDDHPLVRRVFDEGNLYELVATADFTDVEDFYSATQNGVHSSSWSLAPPRGVTLTKSQSLKAPDGTFLGLRSTSVGDIIVADEKTLLCSMMGFQEI